MKANVLPAAARGSSEIEVLRQRIYAHGYRLEFHDYCENSDTPGWLGQIRGVTDRNKKLVRISTKANPTRAAMIDILQHELRHLDEPEWDCGNRDAYGRGGPNAKPSSLSPSHDRPQHQQ